MTSYDPLKTRLDWLSETSSELEQAFGKHWSWLKENAFLAGGAVRDALTGATPKDLDIFFKVDPTDFLQTLCESDRDGYLMRNQQSGGWPTFMPEATKVDGLYATMGYTEDSYKDISVRSITDNAITLCSSVTPISLPRAVFRYGRNEKGVVYKSTVPVQFCYPSYGSPLAVIRGFDFDANMFAYDFKKGELVAHSKHLLNDIVSRYSYERFSDLGDKDAIYGTHGGGPRLPIRASVSERTLCRLKNMSSGPKGEQVRAIAVIMQRLVDLQNKQGHFSWVVSATEVSQILPLLGVTTDEQEKIRVSIQSNEYDI